MEMASEWRRGAMHLVHRAIPGPVSAMEDCQRVSGRKEGVWPLQWLFLARKGGRQGTKAGARGR
jgi:hypothetical protein